MTTAVTPQQAANRATPVHETSEFTLVMLPLSTGSRYYVLDKRTKRIGITGADQTQAITRGIMDLDRVTDDTLYNHRFNAMLARFTA